MAPACNYTPLSAEHTITIKMANFPLDVIIGILALSGGLLSAGWGWKTWQHPDKLKPGSLMYRLLLADWRTGPRSNDSKSQELTEKRVEYYAIRAIIGGILGALAGLMLVCGRFGLF